MKVGMDAVNRRAFLSMLAGTAVALSVCASASRAQAFLYWTDSYRPNHIGRANLDGSGIAREFIFIGKGHDPSFFAPPDDLAVDESFIYWSTAGSALIGRARLDGEAVNRQFITGIQTSGTGGGIAVDGHHIYWGYSDCHFDSAGTQCTTGGIGRVSLDGTGIEPRFVDGIHPVDIAVDSSHIYWTSAESTVGRANIDGTGVNPEFVIEAGAPRDFSRTDVAVDSRHVYWTNTSRPFSAEEYYGPTIGRASLDGTGVEQEFVRETLFSEDYAERLWAPTDLWVDAAHVYWADSTWPYDTHPIAWIGRATPEGDPELAIGAPGHTVSALAVDAGTDTAPPETTITMGAPHRTHKTELEFEFDSSERSSTFRCRLDEGRWKPCESPKRIAQLARGKHRFQVRASDAAGNPDPTPAQDRFRVVG